MHGWHAHVHAVLQDPAAKKPEDWEDNAMIPDPEDKKPAGWDDIPKSVPDPEAKKPAEWDEKEDGEWTPPEVPNPEYKGEWTPKMMENPKYKVRVCVWLVGFTLYAALLAFET